MRGQASANSLVRLLNGSIYIPLGMILRYYLDRNAVGSRSAIIVSSLILAGGMIMGVIVRAKGLTLDAITIFTACALFIIVVLLNDRVPFKTYLIRHISSAVYFVHLYIWTFYYTIMYGKKTYGLDCFLAVSVFSVLSGLIYEAVKRKYHTKQTDRQAYEKNK